MKKVLFALFAFVVSATMVSANTIATNAETVLVQDDKVKIQPEELPEAVKTALNSEDYVGWQISSAYKHADGETYEVELKNDAETKTVKFDKEGNIID
jgi:hypothetical protein